MSDKNSPSVASDTTEVRTAEEQQWLEELAKECHCCEGLMAGGVCDDVCFCGSETDEYDEYDEEYIQNAPVKMGLFAQGHISTIEKMLAENATWEEIGEKINWCPKTAKAHYEDFKNLPF